MELWYKLGEMFRAHHMVKQGSDSSSNDMSQGSLLISRLVSLGNYMIRTDNRFKSLNFFVKLLEWKSAKCVWLPPIIQQRDWSKSVVVVRGQLCLQREFRITLDRLQSETVSENKTVKKNKEKHYSESHHRKLTIYLSRFLEPLR